MARSLHSDDRQFVGPLLPPPGTYSFTAEKPPIVAPDGEPLAQLSQVPDSLREYVGAAFPPFGPRPRKVPTRLSPDEERISYRIVGIIQYRGDGIEIIIETIAPSRAALRKELVLGNPAGSLPNGTLLSAIKPHHLRWRSRDLIVDLYDVNGRLSPTRLRSLAAGVIIA